MQGMYAEIAAHCTGNTRRETKALRSSVFCFFFFFFLSSIDRSVHSYLRMLSSSLFYSVHYFSISQSRSIHVASLSDARAPLSSERHIFVHFISFLFIVIIIVFASYSFQSVLWFLLLGSSFLKNNFRICIVIASERASGRARARCDVVCPGHLYISAEPLHAPYARVPSI